jgi:hypothetical protein
MTKDSNSGIERNLFLLLHDKNYSIRNRALKDLYINTGTLKGQSHEKVGEWRIWGVNLGLN